MEARGYFVGLGRSFTTSPDNAMQLHKVRHNALDSQTETEYWLEAHQLDLQTAGKDSPIRNLTDKEWGYGVLLERWEMHTDVVRPKSELCKSSNYPSFTSRYHPPIVFALKATFRREKNMHRGYPTPRFSDTRVTSDKIATDQDLQLKLQKLETILRLILRGYHAFKRKAQSPQQNPRTPDVNDQTAKQGEASISGHRKGS
ncbi:hypothetical protein IMSHALPRED_008909 [Imshaugia aleurites]|uniref:Uncharacterized protein n=1 Tax=Imshaugia aleurites TaxID=172621 RepID=A0A8H3G3P8_9LECA|nr:hypothetical protein IMSHALPRED_008909 [Imshaugia aleurites]